MFTGDERKLAVAVETDGFLVSASSHGDREAYASLVERYSRSVFAVCLGILGNVSDAEDAAQDTFIKGFTKLTALRDGERFKAWIMQIARNLCRDYKRKAMVQNRYSAEQSAEESAPQRDFGDLRQALEKLPQKHRLPLMLFYFNGHSAKSVAEVLEISEAGACTRLARARRELRTLLETGKVRTGDAM